VGAVGFGVGSRARCLGQTSRRRRVQGAALFQHERCPEDAAWLERVRQRLIEEAWDVLPATEKSSRAARRASTEGYGAACASERTESSTTVCPGLTAAATSVITSGFRRQSL
jgi:hypothetical protein